MKGDKKLQNLGPGVVTVKEKGKGNHIAVPFSCHVLTSFWMLQLSIY